ncbi:MAG: hypothetical protein GYA24_05940 [Candidatus Lokiarchaeota archaeon]|nr:hypothetical protein [Candidatus Lokiarchaeota archaeon]
MYKPSSNFAEKRSKVITATAIFAGLFVLGNFISIPEVGSLEMLITWVCAGIFGPYVSIIAGVIGEGISLFIFPTNPLFIPTKLAGAALTALIMGLGRRLAFVVNKQVDREKRVRMVVESIFFVAMLAARLALYLLYNAAMGIPGYELVLTVNFLFKVAFLPIGLILVEGIRRGIGRVYYDMDRIDTSTLPTK